MWTTQPVGELHLFVSPHPPGNLGWEVVETGGGREWAGGVPVGCRWWEALGRDGTGCGLGGTWDPSGWGSRTLQRGGHVPRPLRAAPRPGVPASHLGAAPLSTRSF